jgi:hypothetical protein
VVEWYVGWGTSRIRTHVDTGSLLAVEALIELREDLRGKVEIQIVAFPQEGILRAKGRRETWEEAVRLGCDVVGGIPHFERTTEEGWQSVRLVYDLAEKDAAGNAAEGTVITHGSSRTYARASDGRLLVLVGVRDLAVVDTGDAVLVCHLDLAQQVKDIVDYLGAHGMDRHV